MRTCLVVPLRICLSPTYSVTQFIGFTSELFWLSPTGQVPKWSIFHWPGVAPLIVFSAYNSMNAQLNTWVYFLFLKASLSTNLYLLKLCAQNTNISSIYRFDQDLITWTVMHKTEKTFTNSNIKLYPGIIIWKNVILFLTACLCTKLLSNPFSLAKLLWFQFH